MHLFKCALFGMMLMIMFVSEFAAAATGEKALPIDPRFRQGYIVPNIPAAAIQIDAFSIVDAERKVRNLVGADAKTACQAVDEDLRNIRNWRVMRGDKELQVLQRTVPPRDCTTGVYQAILSPGAIRPKSKDSKPDEGTAILREGETIDVRLVMPSGGVADGKPISERVYRASAIVPAPSVQAFTIVLDPKQAQGQELIGGGKKDVTQLGLKLDIPAIGVLSVPGTRTYFSTDSLLSSQSKDKQAKVDAKLGLERSLLDSWYVPGFVEVKYIANQSFSNTSVVSTAGIRTIVPWAWSEALLWNNFVRAPFSPIFTVGVQYENRLKQDPLVTNAHVKENLARLAGEIEWNPIYLFAGEDITTLSDKITLAIKLKGWFFPDEKATGGAKVRKTEGHTDISLFVPLNGIPNAVLGTAKNPGSRLKLQYERGANEANGFTRSDSIKLGVEIATQ